MPREIKETRCTCSACGHVWYYGKQEVTEAQGAALQNCGGAMQDTGSTMMCCFCWPSAPRRNVVDLNRCPKCGSRAIEKETVTHVV